MSRAPSASTDADRARSNLYTCHSKVSGQARSVGSQAAGSGRTGTVSDVPELHGDEDHVQKDQ